MLASAPPRICHTGGGTPLPLTLGQLLPPALACSARMLPLPDAGPLREHAHMCHGQTSNPLEREASEHAQRRGPGHGGGRCKDTGLPSDQSPRHLLRDSSPRLQVQAVGKAGAPGTPAHSDTKAGGGFSGWFVKTVTGLWQVSSEGPGPGVASGYRDRQPLASSLLLWPQEVSVAGKCYIPSHLPKRKGSFKT